MSMLRKFASIDHPETHAYAYDSDACSSNAPVHTSFRMFQTYGDGLTQHSGDWPVTTEYMADFMLSLAAAMLEDGELADRLVYTLHQRPSAETIAFCAGVVFKPIDVDHSWEKKQRYFSVSEREITTSEAKQYDKRYERVERRHDGTPDAIYTMLIPEYANGLERYLYAQAIREWLFAQPDDGRTRHYMPLPARFLKWTEDNDKARDLMHALEAAQAVCKAAQLRRAAENTITARKRDLERAKEQAATSTTEEVA